MERRKQVEKQEFQEPKYKRGERVWLAGLFDQGEREIVSFYWNGKGFMYYFRNFRSPYPEKCISPLPDKQLPCNKK